MHHAPPVRIWNVVGRRLEWRLRRRLRLRRAGRKLTHFQARVLTENFRSCHVGIKVKFRRELRVVPKMGSSERRAVDDDLVVDANSSVSSVNHSPITNGVGHLGEVPHVGGGIGVEYD